MPYGALCVVVSLRPRGLARVDRRAVFVAAGPGFFVRVFVMLRDCAHGSLLPSRRANAVLGSILGLPRLGVSIADRRGLL